MNRWVEAADPAEAEARVRTLIEEEIRSKITAGAVLPESRRTITIEKLEPVDAPPAGPLQGWFMFPDDGSVSGAGGA